MESIKGVYLKEPKRSSENNGGDDTGNERREKARGKQTDGFEGRAKRRAEKLVSDRSDAPRGYSRPNPALACLGVALGLLLARTLGGGCRILPGTFRLPLAALLVHTTHKIGVRVVWILGTCARRLPSPFLGVFRGKFSGDLEEYPPIVFVAFGRRTMGAGKAVSPCEFGANALRKRCRIDPLEKRLDGHALGVHERDPFREGRIRLGWDGAVSETQNGQNFPQRPLVDHDPCNSIKTMFL